MWKKFTSVLDFPLELCESPTAFEDHLSCRPSFEATVIRANALAQAASVGHPSFTPGEW